MSVNQIASVVLGKQQSKDEKSRLNVISCTQPNPIPSFHYRNHNPLASSKVLECSM